MRWFLSGRQSGVNVFDALRITLIFMVVSCLCQAAAVRPDVTIPPNWQRVGPYGGGMIDVEFAPSDSSIVYCLTNVSNAPIYRSTDRGVNWEPIITDFRFPLDPDQLAVNPRDPELLLVTDFYLIYRSADHGVTWELVATSNDLVRVMFDPYDSEVAYAREASVQKSTDRGCTWQQIADLRIDNLDIDPYDHEHLIAFNDGSDRPKRGLFTSWDGGNKWQRLPDSWVKTPHATRFEYTEIRQVRFGKQPDSIYLVLRRPDNDLLKSTDNGYSWTIVYTGFQATVSDLQIITEPQERLYAAVGNSDVREQYPYCGVFASSDGGEHWDNLTVDHVKLFYTKVRIDPFDGNHLMAADGSYSLQNSFNGFQTTFDGGRTWRLPSPVFPGLRAATCAASPLSSGLLLMQEEATNHILRSTDAGISWSYTKFENPEYYPINGAIDFSRFDPLLVYQAGGSEMFRSTDAGQNWERIGPTDFKAKNSICTSPFHDLLVIAGGYNGQLARTTDSGDSWSIVYDSHTDYEWIDAVECSPAEPNLIYAVKKNWAPQEVVLLQSTDTGVSWLWLSRLPSSDLQAFAVSATNPPILYACDIGSPMMRSTDQGLTWSWLDSYPFISAFNCLTTPSHPSWLWTTSASYIIGSYDLGESWYFIPVPAFIDGIFLESSDTLTAGTNQFRYIIMNTLKDGIWLYSEQATPQILMGGVVNYFDGTDHWLNFYAWVKTMPVNQSVSSIKILVDDRDTDLCLYDDGTHGDVSENDGLFTLQLNIGVGDTISNYRFSMVAITDSGMLSFSWPDLNVY